ncbi:FG-GAP repeat domain-containing protein [Actinoplanes sp. GCM10030250]|uniref:FG-GAP repeat domain-containing protein n=1 Tax=Actinoplanes sp. GCM10030250 TaxID=3273376 RepID=UPI0036123322
MSVRFAALKACSALTLAAGVLSLPAAAHAGPVSLAAAPSSACLNDGVTAVDRAIADRVRPSMNGRRLGRAVTGRSISCARIIVGTVLARGLPERAAVIAVTTAIAESTLHNHAVATDHDSLGLFQQRPSTGWGRPDQLTDPGYATNAFLDAMIRKYPGGSWMSGDIGQICQRVQTSAHPGAYSPEAHDAQRIVAQLWERTASPVTTPGSTAAAPKKPAGPFQQALAATYTGLGPTDERYQVSTADWNGDRRADLVVIQGTGTITGKIELRIMDGAANFQGLLLHTATVLAATGGSQLSLADWNADGRPDLVAVQKSGTASARTELRILDGASNFQHLLLETATPLPATDDRHAFSLTDWNADGRPDLVAVQTSGTASRHTEVRVLDGAANFQQDLVPAAVTPAAATPAAATPAAVNPAAATPAAADGPHRAFVADWNRDKRPDLVIVRTSATKSGKTEVQVIDGASGLRRSVLNTATAQGLTDQRHDVSVTDWNGDGRLDLMVVHKSGAASGRTEAVVLGG